jgi:hypothetical protein
MRQPADAMRQREAARQDGEDNERAAR